MIDGLGGYFELELKKGEMPYFNNAYPVNVGHAGLDLIIKQKKYTSIWLPAYNCRSFINWIEKKGMRIKYYSINHNLDPLDLPILSNDEGFLYINYFGIKDQTCDFLSNQYKKNLILDLAQAFFYLPQNDITAFNSSRKFFGVPDGGFVFSDFIDEISLTRAKSYQTALHLLLRSDGEIAQGFSAFQQNEMAMSEWEPQRMSLLSEKIHRSIDYEFIKNRRRENFVFLHERLSGYNQLKTVCDDLSGVPLCYPLLIEGGDTIRKELIASNIFVPTYWPDIEDLLEGREIEQNLQKNLVPIPIDQRYSLEDMEYIVNIIIDII